MKRVFVLILVFSMLLATFSPALGVVAENLQSSDQSVQGTGGTINYVSLGDSMTNGMGMPGYKNGGYLEVAPASYPAQFAAFLAGYTGAIAEGQTEYFGERNVHLTQLATSGARAEDVYYIINRGTENEVEPDIWTYNQLLNSGYRWGDISEIDHSESNDQVAEQFRTAIENAHVISYALGNCNFGAFLLSQISAMVGFKSYNNFAEPEEIEAAYAHYTFDNALILLEADEDTTELVKEIYNYVVDYCTAENLPVELIKKCADLASYTVASYVITVKNTVEYINKVNPDVTFMFVPLINNAYDFTIDLVDDGAEKKVNIGELISLIYAPINAYVASFITLKQNDGEYPDMTFYYADLPVDENGETIKVETYGQAFEQIYTEIDNPNEYPAGRAFCHECFVPDVRRTLFSVVFGDKGEYFDYDDVKAYETAQAKGEADLASYIYYNPAKSKWIALYLGVVEAIFGSINSEAEIDLNEIDITNSTDFDMFDLIEPYTQSIDERLDSKASENVNQKLAEELVNEWDKSEEEALSLASIPAYTKACEDELMSVGMIKALLSLYGRSVFGNGLAGHTSEAGHRTITRSLSEAYDNEYTMSDETAENMKDAILLAMENKELAYKIAYMAVKKEGYIDDAIEKIDKVLNVVNIALDEVEKDVLPLTDELYEDVVIELRAIISTLEEVRDTLANDKADNLDGFMALVEKLEADYERHSENLANLFAQAEIDATAAIETAKVIFNDEVIPALYDLAQECRYLALDYLFTNIKFIYYRFPEFRDTVVYPLIFDVMAELEIIAGDAMDKVMEAYFTVLVPCLEEYKSFKEAILEADKIIHEIYTTLVMIDEKLGYPSIDIIGTTVVECAELFNNMYFYGPLRDLEEMLEPYTSVLLEIADVAEREFESAVEFYNELIVKLEEVYEQTRPLETVAHQIFSYAFDFIDDTHPLEKFKGHCDNIVDLIDATYSETKDQDKVFEEIYAYLMKVYNGAFETEYVITENSTYVSIGNAVYGEELAKMLFVEEYYNFAINGNYLDKIADAELITVRFDNGEFMEFLMGQIEGIALTFLGKEYKLDWDKHLDAEGQAALDEVLAQLKADLIESGIADELIPVIKDMLQSVIKEQFGTVGIRPRVDQEKVCQFLLLVAETVLYAYADLGDRIGAVLKDIYTVAPNATVVITGAQFSLDGLGFGLGDMDLDLGEYEEMIDYVLKAHNAQFFGYTLTMDNAIFVDSIDALDIYDALNPRCIHLYDDCIDTTCNICGEVRVAPGHSFTNFVSNNDATCTEDGTETAKCDNCSAMHTQIDVDSALGHSYGEWTVLRKATALTRGKRQCVCQRCGYANVEIIPVTKNWFVTTLGIVMVVGGIGAGVYFYKKNKITPEVPKKEEE